MIISPITVSSRISEISLEIFIHYVFIYLNTFAGDDTFSCAYIYMKNKT